VEGREHAVGAAVLGGQGGHFVDHVEARVGVLGHARRLEGVVRLSAPETSVGRDLAGEMHLARTYVAGQAGQLVLRPAAQHHQSAATLAQRLVELRERLEQELRPRARGEAAVQKAIVETEDGYDHSGALERATQGRVVLQPEVAAKPDQGAHRQTLRAPPGPGIKR
jgi:hypothetical protein